jgi:hypothetical protein
MAAMYCLLGTRQSPKSKMSKQVPLGQKQKGDTK